MHKFKLSSIVEQHSLDTKTLALELFPENKYPMIALTRVMNGEALLNSEQISKLSFITGIPISVLFDGEGWESVPTKEENIIIFQNGEYRAELDRSTWVTKLTHKGSIFHEAVILDGTSVPMSKFLSEIDTIILNTKSNG